MLAAPRALRFLAAAVMLTVALANNTTTTTVPPAFAHTFGQATSDLDICTASGGLLGDITGKLDVVPMTKADENDKNKMRDQIQSFRGTWKSNQFKDPNLKFDEYFLTIVPFFAPIAAFAAIAFVCCLPFSIGRFFRDCGHLTPCCKCDDVLGKICIKMACGCCCYKPSPEGYSKCKKILPLIFYLIFGLVACAIALFSVVQVGAFIGGITDLVCRTDEMRLELSQFMGGMSPAFTSINTLVGNAIDTSAADLQGTSGLPADFAAINTDLDAYDAAGKALATVNDKDGNPFVSPIVANINNNGVATIKAGFQEASDQATAVDQVVTSITSLLLDVEDVIKSSITNVEGIITQGRTYVDDGFGPIIQVLKDVFGPVGAYTNPIAVGAAGLVIVPFLLVCLGIFFLKCGQATNCTGGILDKMDDACGGHCLGIAVVLSFLAMSFCFIVSALVTPATIISSDLCVVIEELPTELSDYIQIDATVPANQNPASLIGACFRNESLATALNLTRDLTFVDIDFSSMATVRNGTDTPDFSSFTTYHNSIMAMTAATSYGWTAARDNANQDAKTAIDAQIQTLQDALAPAATKVAAVEAKLVRATNGTKKAQNTLTPLSSTVTSILEQSTKCGFLKTVFDDMYFSLCSKSLTGAFYVSLCFFLCGLFTLPMVICNVLILLRNAEAGEGESGAAVTPAGDSEKYAAQSDGGGAQEA
eukprot:g5360.t1